jgi:hypothetical protein
MANMMCPISRQYTFFSLMGIVVWTWDLNIKIDKIQSSRKQRANKESERLKET